MTTKTARTASKTNAASGEAASKRPRGGQTEYLPEYCDIAFETLAQGHSLTGLAGCIGVARSTIFKWRDDFPEFNEACVRGMAAATYWWEQRARESAAGGKGNPATIIFGLKNRAADDWRERVEHTGANGGAIETVTRIEYAVVKPHTGEAAE